MLTDVQAPFLGTPSAPPKSIDCKSIASSISPSPAASHLNHTNVKILNTDSFPTNECRPPYHHDNNIS